jgi:hypothetical protein
MHGETIMAAKDTTGPATIAEALANAQAELTDPVKDSINPHFKSRYADLATILKTVRPVLARHGIAVTQTTNITDNDTVILITALMWRGESIIGRYPVAPVKADPQGYGSAMTYARRYALQAIVGVAADDDDDGNAASAPKPSAPRIDETSELIGRIKACNDLDDLRAMRAAVSAAGATASAAWKARGEFLKAAAESP